MVIPNAQLEFLQTEFKQPDRIMYAYLWPGVADRFKGHPVDDKGVLVRVADLRAGIDGVEVLTSYGEPKGWFNAYVISMGWDICDGCKNRLSWCDCHEIDGDFDEPF